MAPADEERLLFTEVQLINGERMIESETHPFTTSNETIDSGRDLQRKKGITWKVDGGLSKGVRGLPSTPTTDLSTTKGGCDVAQ